jgi:hypothetical protein
MIGTGYGQQASDISSARDFGKLSVLASPTPTAQLTHRMVLEPFLFRT